MRTGDIVKKDLVNTHLAEGVEYIEVFPEGTVPELSVLRSIPVELRTYSQKTAMRGQSPLLVCRKYWEAHCAGRFAAKGGTP